MGAAARTSGKTIEPHVAAVVLAAGLSTRMGGQKCLLPVEARPMVQRVVDAALASAAAEVVVVLGHEAVLVRETLRGRPVAMVVNPRYAEGMSTSLQAGIQAVAGECEAALFLLGDQPFVTPELLDRLIARFAADRSSVVRPTVGGRPANPVLVCASLFPDLLAQRGDVGGREVVSRHSSEVSLVAVDDARLVMDIDTAADYGAVAGDTPCSRTLPDGTGGAAG